MDKGGREKGLDWLANLFGGGIGDVVKAKKTRKQQLEDAVREVGKKRKNPKNGLYKK